MNTKIEQNKTPEVTSFKELDMYYPNQIPNFFKSLGVDNFVIGTPGFGGENDWGLVTPEKFIDIIIEHEGVPHSLQTFSDHPEKSHYVLKGNTIVREMGTLRDLTYPVLKTNDGSYYLQTISYNGIKFTLTCLPQEDR